MRLRDLLYMNRSDRGVLAIVLLLAVVAIAAFHFASGDDMTVGGERTDSVRMHGKNRAYEHEFAGEETQHGYYAENAGRSIRLFPFDPNTADSTQLLSLGLSRWQVRSIYKYRAAGGVFRQPEDFARLYGLTKKQYEDLRPYIRISNGYKPAIEFYEPRPRHVNIPDSIAARHVEKLKAGETIELNAADTTLLMRVPGIGRYYARQIVNRRTWLGGFYTADQLMEIEYLPKEALNYFHVDVGKIKKLNVNKLSLSELKRHPYINYYQAKDIVDYRRMRGSLTTIEELRLMKDFTEKDIERLRHYLEY